MNVDELKPGAELDLLVAEKVMGWKFYCVKRGKYIHFIAQVPGEPEPWKHSRNDSEDNYVRGCHADYNPMKHIMSMPDFHPSTSIADAWEVVEKMGFNCLWKDATGWTCRFYGVRAAESSASTAPHAICLAALKAVMKESEQ